MGNPIFLRKACLSQTHTQTVEAIPIPRPLLPHPQTATNRKKNTDRSQPSFRSLHVVDTRASSVLRGSCRSPRRRKAWGQLRSRSTKAIDLLGSFNGFSMTSVQSISELAVSYGGSLIGCGPKRKAPRKEEQDMFILEKGGRHDQPFFHPTYQDLPVLDIQPPRGDENRHLGPGRSWGILCIIIYSIHVMCRPRCSVLVSPYIDHVLRSILCFQCRNTE